jgi:hypothetical protein
MLGHMKFVEEKVTDNVSPSVSLNDLMIIVFIFRIRGGDFANTFFQFLFVNFDVFYLSLS